MFIFKFPTTVIESNLWICIYLQFDCIKNFNEFIHIWHITKILNDQLRDTDVVVQIVSDNKLFNSADSGGVGVGILLE